MRFAFDHRRAGRTTPGTFVPATELSCSDFETRWLPTDHYYPPISGFQIFFAQRFVRKGLFPPDFTHWHAAVFGAIPLGTRAAWCATTTSTSAKTRMKPHRGSCARNNSVCSSGLNRSSAFLPAVVLPLIGAQRPRAGNQVGHHRAYHAEETGGTEVNTHPIRFGLICSTRRRNV